jgi:hypothetical protein
MTEPKRSANCQCGALRDASSARCRKCRARIRWHKRKAWRTHHNSNRKLAGRK